MTSKRQTQLKEKSFYTKVYALVKKVPHGKVTTYGAIAEKLGTKLSARMVGWAMSSAPNNVPAHRVLNRFGALTGKHHFAHPNLMKQLLLDEGIAFNADETVKMEHHFFDFKPKKKPPRS
jgi:methylated-DNA-protein-cysteine methyltransferase related protein